MALFIVQLSKEHIVLNNQFGQVIVIVTAQPQPEPNSTSTRVGVDKVISWTTPPTPPHPVQLLRHKLTVVVVVNCPS